MRVHFTFVFCALVLAGCQKTMPFEELGMINEKLYQSGARGPYTGRVTGIPYRSMPILSFDLNLMEYKGVAIKAGVKGDNVQLMPIKTSEVVCNAEFKDGIINGSAECMPEGTTQVILGLAYKDGRLHGPYAVYDINDPELKLFEGSYEDGNRSGVNVIRARENGVVLKRWTSSSSTSDPIEEFYLSGKKRLYKPVKAGLVHGDVVTYREDGSVLRKIPYVKGRRNGWSEWFDPEAKQFIRDEQYRDDELVQEAGIEEVRHEAPLQAYMLRPGVKDLPFFSPLGEKTNSYLLPGEPAFFLRCEGNGTKFEGQSGRWCLVYSDRGLGWSLDTYFEPATIIRGQGFEQDVVYPTARGPVSVDQQAADSAESTSQFSSSGRQACVDKKIAAFRAEVGEDEPLRMDVLGEWEEECGVIPSD